MVELTWQGKYDEHGKCIASCGSNSPFRPSRR